MAIDKGKQPPQLVTLPKEDIRKAILKALDFSYTSRSCKDAIATGNSYQSIKLDGVERTGFRTTRSYLFDLFDFKGKRVLDIGSNLGELSRFSLDRGAAFTHGVEYDALYVLVADLISIYNGYASASFTFEQNDITKKFKFSEKYDITLAFSVFTYIDKRLPEIAAATKEILIVETHAVKEDWGKNYITPLREHFPTIVVLGESDWGVAQKFSEGRRIVFACFKNKTLAWETINRIQTTHPSLSSRLMWDPFASQIGALGPLKAALNDELLAKVKKLPPARPLAGLLGYPPPSSMNDLAYWLEFYRGYQYFRQHPSDWENNPYLRLLREMRDSQKTFDPGAFAQMKDEPALRERVKARMRNFKALAEGNAENLESTILFDVDGEPPQIQLRSDQEGSPIGGSRLDGYHRTGAAVLCGVRSLSAYQLKTYGSL